VLSEMTSARVDRDEWRRRIERWKDSGLTAKEFAAEKGINAGTLQFWRSKLKGDLRPARRAALKGPSAKILSGLVEVRGASAIVDQRFEVELRNGRRIRVAADFQPEGLKNLLALLESA
jgi:hypothetical protein